MVIRRTREHFMLLRRQAVISGFNFAFSLFGRISCMNDPNATPEDMPTLKFGLRRKGLAKGRYGKARTFLVMPVFFNCSRKRAEVSCWTLPSPISLLPTPCSLYGFTNPAFKITYVESIRRTYPSVSL